MTTTDGFNLSSWIAAAALLATVLCLQAFLPYSWLHEQVSGETDEPERNYVPPEIPERETIAQLAASKEERQAPATPRARRRKSERSQIIPYRPWRQPAAGKTAPSETATLPTPLDPPPATPEPGPAAPEEAQLVVVRNPKRATRPFDPTALAPAFEGGRRSRLRTLPSFRLDRQLEEDPRRGLAHLLSAATDLWERVSSVRATLVVRELRNDVLQPSERISLLSHKPGCTLLHWATGASAGKTILHVEGRYEGLLSVRVKERENWVHRQMWPDDWNYVFDHLTLRPAELSFGERLAAVVQDLKAEDSENLLITYHGIRDMKSTGRRAFSLELAEVEGEETIRRKLVWFDTEFLMPVLIEEEVGGALLRRHEYRDVVLNPVDQGRAPQIIPATFYRSRIFPGVWESSEWWRFENLTNGRVR